MKKLLFILFIFMVTGCANDASDEDKASLLNAFQSEKYLPSGLILVGSSKVVSSYFDATPIYKNLDVYERNGDYYSVNFDRITLHTDEKTKDCDFIVEIYDHVTLLKNQEVTETRYREDTHTNEYYTEIKDVYETDDDYVKKYCVRKEKKLITRRVYYVIDKINSN